MTITTLPTHSRVPAWRTLGSWVNVKDEAGMSASQIIEAAGLDWQVEKHPLHTTVLTDAGVTTVEVPGKVATVRVDKDGTATALGVVSPKFTIVQNHEAFDLLDSLTYEAGATYNAAGVIGGGRRVFMSARLPEGVTVGGGDRVDTYLFATNAHDGSAALRIDVTHIRLACTNQMRKIKRDALASISLRHTHHMKVRVEQVRQALGIVYEARDEFQKEADALLGQAYTDLQFDRLVRDLFPLEQDASTRQQESVKRTRDEVHALYRSSTQDGIRGTAWGAWQAVVEYADWSRPVRSTGAEAASLRAERTLMGAGDELKEQALALITA